jgi:hypothetical protein
LTNLWNFSLGRADRCLFSHGHTRRAKVFLAQLSTWTYRSIMMQGRQRFNQQTTSFFSLLDLQKKVSTFEPPTNQPRSNVADFDSMQTTYIRFAYASCSPMTKHFSEPSKDPTRARHNCFTARVRRTPCFDGHLLTPRPV